MPQNETLTVLFTDVEGSTELRTSQGDEAADAVLRVHEDIARDAITTQGGTLVKSTGDGFLVTFTSPRAALGCAIAVQRALAERREADPSATPRVRIGINAGDAVERDGDVHGQAVHAAARLTDAARGDEILVSRVVHDLAGVQPDLRFVDRGALRLKGFPAPWHVYEVDWRPIEHGAPRPRPIAAATHSALLGRDADLAHVGSALGEAARGDGHLLVIEGEAGIGKTSVARAIASLAPNLGFGVGWGNAWDGRGAPAFWPWTQACRNLGVHEIVEQLSGATADAPGLDPEAARFRLLDGAAESLLRHTETSPVLVVLDDLHWADPSSLDLLTMVAERCSGRRLVIVAVYRPEEVRSPRFDRLRRFGRMLVLHGLGPGEVERLLAREGVSTEAITAAQVHQRTGGNPFFTLELARLLVSGSSTEALPEGVREAMRRRLSSVGDDCRALLDLAAVVGQEVGVDVLRLVVGDGLLDLLDEARQAGVLTPLEGSVGRYRFGHPLLREATYESLTSEARTRSHLTVARALETRARDGAEISAAAIAHHFLRAVPVASPVEAAEHGARAGEEALARLAYEEAAGWFARALDAVELASPIDDHRRTELLLACGEAEFRAGAPNAAASRFRRAVEVARRTHAPDLMARAAIALQAVPTTYGSTPTERVELLEQVVNAERELDDRWAALARAALARERYHTRQDPDRMAERLAATAVELAKASGDHAVLITCLLAHHDALWQPGRAAERSAVASELLQAARVAGDPTAAVEAHLMHAIDLLELGDPGAVRALNRFSELALELRQPRYTYLARTRQATAAIIRGRFDEAENLIAEATALANTIDDPDAWNVESVQLWELRGLQGRRAELIDRVGRWAHVMFVEWYRAKLTIALLDDGQVEAAAEAYAEVAACDPEQLAFDNLWLTQLATMAEAAARLGDVDGCRRLYRLLEPHAGSMVVVAGGVTCPGAVDHYLGLLAQALGEAARARRHLAAAVQMHERIGSPPWAQRSRDAVRAPTGALVHEGASWRVEFGGQAVHVPHAKGLHDIATLVAAEGQDVHVGDLVGSAEAVLGADAVLDERARREFRARLAALDAQLEAADQRGDEAASAAALVERAALVDALGAARGLGGRTRLLGDSTERARKAVTARIRDALRRLDDLHPPLAAHLRASITTGTWCRYEPAEPVAWEIR